MLPMICLSGVAHAFLNFYRLSISINLGVGHKLSPFVYSLLGVWIEVDIDLESTTKLKG